MNQRTKLLNLIIDLCNSKGSRTFTLTDLMETFGDFNSIEIGGKTPQATVRRLLQELRDDKSITFLDNRGAYVLNGVDILKDEVEEKSIQLIYDTSAPIEKEYLIETYARNRGWVKKAKEILGLNCLYPHAPIFSLKKMERLISKFIILFRFIWAVTME
ncbi:MAG: hypothetical protein ABL884_08255 [Methyloglobulus sp.]